MRTKIASDEIVFLHLRKMVNLLCKTRNIFIEKGRRKKIDLMKSHKSFNINKPFELFD